MISKHKISWSTPENIDFFISTNQTGMSKGIYQYANFSTQVGDDDACVYSNIAELKKLLNIDSISFMNQKHSSIVLEAKYQDIYLDCDAQFTANKNLACAVLTADCIPILVTNRQGSFIGCIHAGWKGLKNKVIENFFDRLHFIKKSDFIVLIGPCISASKYEVGQELYENFINYRKRFRKNKSGNYYMNLRYIAKDILSQLGISNVTISRSCTYNDSFYSYRKDGVTGRFISLIWFKR